MDQTPNCRNSAVELPQYRSEDKARGVGTAELSCDCSVGATGKRFIHRVLRIVEFRCPSPNLTIHESPLSVGQPSARVLLLLRLQSTIPPHRHQGIQREHAQCPQNAVRLNDPAGYPTVKTGKVVALTQKTNYNSKP